MSKSYVHIYKMLLVQDWSFLSKISLVFFLGAVPVEAAAPLPLSKGVFAGTEVIGTDHQTAEHIRQLIPLAKGTSASLDENTFNAWCEHIKEKNKDKEINCSFVAYQDNQFYYIVNVMPHEKKIEQYFRNIPDPVTRKPLILPVELEQLHDQWYEKLVQLFRSGEPITEFYEKFLDYNQPELHHFSIKLSELASKNKELLLNIIRYSKDVKQRRKAATLLSWSQNPENFSKILQWNLLQDPDKNVRNNLARYLAIVLEREQNEHILRKSMTIFCRQITLPSHSDRNKALVSILGILKNHQSLSKAIDSECKQDISYIADMSILENVGGMAKEILAILQSSKV